MVANITFHSIGCILIPLIIFFAVKKLFSLLKSHLFIFSSVAFLFSVKFKNSLLNQSQGDYLLYFLLGIFQFQSFHSSLFLIYIYFNWRLITLQYCIGFCHASTWIHHGCTCVPHPEPPSHLPPIPSLWVIPVHQPQASCIMHQTWIGDSFHIWYYTCFNAILPNHPTLTLSHRVQKTVCSKHLCLFCCLAYRVIITIFINSIYMH